MISGVVIGIVEDNADPDRMNRVKVRFPVDSGDGVSSSWCRVVMPMAGNDRGLVMLPEVGTEVAVGYAYRTMSPYVLGAVYNGADDTPEPYHNDDGNNDKRVFWSRSGHLLVFDDTDGAEQVGLGAQAGAALDVTSAPVYDVLDSATPKISEHSDGDISWEATNSISIKCVDFNLQAAGSVTQSAGSSASVKASLNADFSGSGQVSVTGGTVAIN